MCTYVRVRVCMCMCTITPQVCDVKAVPVAISVKHSLVLVHGYPCILKAAILPVEFMAGHF